MRGQIPCTKPYCSGYTYRLSTLCQACDPEAVLQMEEKMKDEQRLALKKELISKQVTLEGKQQKKRLEKNCIF